MAGSIVIIGSFVKSFRNDNCLAFISNFKLDDSFNTSLSNSGLIPASIAIDKISIPGSDFFPIIFNTFAYALSFSYLHILIKIFCPSTSPLESFKTTFK